MQSQSPRTFSATAADDHKPEVQIVAFSATVSAAFSGFSFYYNRTPAVLQSPNMPHSCLKYPQLPNGPELAAWLDATPFETDDRPIALRKHVLIGDAILSETQEHVRTLKVEDNSADPFHIVDLVAESCSESKQVTPTP